MDSRRMDSAHAFFGHIAIATAPLSLSGKQLPAWVQKKGKKQAPPQFVRRTYESIIDASCISAASAPDVRYAQLVLDEPHPRTTFSNISERRRQVRGHRILGCLEPNENCRCSRPVHF